MNTIFLELIRKSGKNQSQGAGHHCKWGKRGTFSGFDVPE